MKNSLQLFRFPSGMQELITKLQRSTIWRLMMCMCWHLLHFIVIIVHFVAHSSRLLHHFLISSGILKKYRDLPSHKLRYLAIVLDSEAAADTFRVRKLLQFLSSIGVRNVILYDMDGVLKRSEFSFCDSIPLSDEDKMSIEILSYSDGKVAIARAASFLCSKFMEDDDHHLLGRTRERVIIESDLSDALVSLGYSGAEPELLLVFAPVRCHLGFPAWRIRYTEIVHVGELRSMNRGAVIKAIYDLSKKQQNYGT